MYCTFEHIKEVLPSNILGELSNSSPNYVANTELVQTKISESSAFMDRFIDKRYHLPLTETHELLKMICVELTIYKLYRMKSSTAYDANYDKAIDYLSSISGGVYDLPNEKKKMRIYMKNL